MAEYLRKQIPVLVGRNYEHVMCQAVVNVEGDNVTVTMSATGHEARELLAVMTEESLMALSFVAIPVTQRNTE
jgi:hypothetical protein